MMISPAWDSRDIVWIYFYNRLWGKYTTFNICWGYVQTVSNQNLLMTLADQVGLAENTSWWDGPFAPSTFLSFIIDPPGKYRRSFWAEPTLTLLISQRRCNGITTKQWASGSCVSFTMDHYLSWSAVFSQTIPTCPGWVRFGRKKVSVTNVHSH